MNDGINGVGWGVELVFNACGFSGEDLRRWGGGIVPGLSPADVLERTINGTADAMFHEAIMTQGWVTLTDTRTMRFLPIRPDILEDFQRRYGLDSAIIPRGKFRGVHEDVLTLDWSNFVAMVGSDMDDELAYTLAQLLVETWVVLERQYHHLPPERSPVSYPLNPYTTWRNVKVPLHPVPSAIARSTATCRAERPRRPRRRGGGQMRNAAASAEDGADGVIGASRAAGLRGSRAAATAICGSSGRAAGAAGPCRTRSV